MILKLSSLLFSFTYNFSGAAGKIGSYKVGTLPAGVPVSVSGIKVLTVISGGAGANISVGTILNPTLFTLGVFNAPLSPNLTLASLLSVQMDSSVNVFLNINAANLTAGSMNFYINYYFG